MTWLSDESGIETSKPRECYLFTLSNKFIRVTSHDQPVTINGSVFTPAPISRSEIQVSSAMSGQKELNVQLPATHEIVRLYQRSGVPPLTATLTVYRKQVNSGLHETIWRGAIASMTFSDHVASFLVPSRAFLATKRRLPVITVGRQCPHILYNELCQVSRTAFRVATTVQSHSGRVVTVASMGANPDSWAQFGELVHIPTGERMTILSQTGTEITMQLDIPEMQAGDAVEVYAGCDHGVNTCSLKFSNTHNFGGFPHLPTKNVFVPNGLGVVTQV